MDKDKVAKLRRNLKALGISEKDIEIILLEYILGLKSPSEKER